MPSQNLDQLAINTIRTLSIDAVQKANSGHPGLPLGAAPMAYVLWTRFLRHNPKNPKWADHDRFAFSAGHGSMLLYSLLYLTGYDLPLEELKNFRQWGSKTPGHPEYRLTPGVELSTGPLGQGFANGVGLAIAEAHLAATYNRPGHTIVDRHTYGLVSDGDLMEGVAYEAASIAGDIESFAEQYQTLVGERGITLSGGQKQRTAIARALIRNPRILILDDALSSVDTHTEDKILNHLREIMQGRTTIFISHRVSTVRNADMIAVLHGGRIVETGTHDELLARNGYYSDLYNKQLLEEELAEV